MTAFRPTPAEQETIASLQIARAPAALIARRLGIDPRQYRAWLTRLAMAVDAEDERSRGWSHGR